MIKIFFSESLNVKLLYTLNLREFYYSHLVAITILYVDWAACVPKVKVFPLQGMKAHGDVDLRVHIYTATEIGRRRVASTTLSRFTFGEIPWYSFYRRLSGPQDQSGYGV